MLLLLLVPASILTVTFLAMHRLCSCPVPPACQENRQPDCGNALNKDPCTKNCATAAFFIVIFLSLVFYFDYTRREHNEDLAVARQKERNMKLGVQQPGPVI